ncbi:MAG: D-amino-acid oxidase [Frankiaceae bacterium]|jgi:glycine/D-amino acid oxidase-like deaminating enzyme|nr:D-amino-acid oxidase [Frankiaceae bacterium]
MPVVLPRACVIGAGPIGLSAARVLAAAGFRVTVIHADHPTTPSATFVGPAAAGLIEPVAMSPADEALVAVMFRYAYRRWLAAEEALGVDARVVRYSVAPGAPPPAWLAEVDGLTQTGISSWAFRTVVVTPVTWLAQTRYRLRARGVQLCRQRVTSPAGLASLTRQFDVVVNATGPGAWALGDEEMFGRRGVLVWVAPHPQLTDVVFDDASFSYVIPQRRLVAVGGTRDEHRGDPRLWPRQPSAADVAEILGRFAQLPGAPDLSTVQVVGATCDYRPARPRLRLETTSEGGRPVVHATGFGGSGWTLAPAAGFAVARLCLTAVGLPEMTQDEADEAEATARAADAR